MEISFQVLKLLLSGLWWMSDQVALASPFPFCDWNNNTADHSSQVNCSHLGLTSVPWGLPLKIQTLDLSYNTITEIRCFEFTNTHHITHLILSQNSIEKIDERAFSSLTELKELNVSRNALAAVTKEMFSGLRNLRVLDLRYNQLQWIHKKAFTDLANLEVLWLQNNNLRAVPDAVNLLTGLKVLSLAMNHLSQLLTEDLINCTNLSILQLEDNLISTVAIGALQKHGNLKTVDLSSNHLRELHDTMVKFLWERGVNLRLHGNPLRCDCASEQMNTGAVWLTDAVFCQGISTLKALERESPQGVKGPLRVHTTNTISGVPGQSLMMSCKANSNGGMILYWKTPARWLTSHNSCISHGNLKCFSNGNLTIANFTCQHRGLYYCFQENNQERVILPYRVEALGTCQNLRPKSRLPREVKVDSSDTVSDSHFAAAVTSSVLVTFFGGFALGAFSRSHVITCLQRAKSFLHQKGIRSRTSSGDNADQITMETNPSGFTSFGNGMPADCDAPSTTPSPPAKAPRSFRSKREQPEDSVCPEGHDSEDQSNSRTTSTAEQDSLETELQHTDPVPPMPARRSRVIKLYNYDEDGQHYSHIKEPEGDVDGVPRPKQRTRSLNRLSAIMSSVETTDLSMLTQPDIESKLGNSSEEESDSNGLQVHLES